MQEKQLNIVTFDNPFPPNYGGVIDVYYKIKTLYDLGIKIHLHCFVNEIPLEFEALEKITASIHFYKTTRKWFYVFSKLPISVISRKDSELVKNLLKNDAPILFEGLKATCLINDFRLKHRNFYLRFHNIEHNYHCGLAKSETLFIKKFLFWREAIKYKNYEAVVSNFSKTFTLSKHENEYVNEKYNNGVYIPVFHGNYQVTEISDFGKFALFHGDLSTADNRKAALFLIEVFKDLPNCDLIIASSYGKELIQSKISNLTNIKFEELNDDKHLELLFSEAHICISWSFQKSGTKLKLINSLFQSRHNIINENISDDDAIISLCSSVSNKEELIQSINKLLKIPYDKKCIEEKKNILNKILDNKVNANQLMKFIH
jgi:hypothetical protein